MDRVPRIIGVAAVLVLSLASWTIFDRAVTSDAPTPTVADRDEVEARPITGQEIFDGGVELTMRDATDEPPRYLAFLPGLASRSYDVSTPATGDDDDRSATGAVDGDHGDFPIEADLFPGESLADTEPIEPGLYATPFGTRDCGFELRRDGKKGGERIIGDDHLAEGRMLVSLNEVEPDRFVPRPQCGSWTPWSPLVEPLVVAGPGDYWLGDLAQGQWLVPPGCLWEEVVGFRGARLSDVIDSGRGPGSLLVDDKTMGIRLRACDQPIVLVAAMPETVDRNFG